MSDRFRIFKRMSKSKKKTAETETPSVSSQQEIPTSSPSVLTSQSPPSKSASTTATAEATSSDHKASRRSRNQTDHPNSRPVIDEEVIRMREEPSRATVTCQGREMEAVRAGNDLQHCKEELARISAVKMEADHENRKLQAEVSSLDREKSRLLTEVERLKEDLQRLRPKLAEKKRTITELKKKLQLTEEEKNQVEKGAKEREQTWQTIRRDVTTKRDDAIRESCKIRRENEKLKCRISKLKTEKSNILLRIWEKKQIETSPSRRATSSKFSYADTRESHSTHGHEESGQYAKVLSLELQLFRQARLVELLLDVIQSYDTQFTVQQRHDLTSAFADAGSIPEIMSRKVTFASDIA